MGTKIGKALIHRINDELVGGYMLLENGNYWSFVASQRESSYGIYFAGFAIEGCTIEKNERKDGMFWVSINNPKERTEGGCAKVLKAARCVKDADGNFEFDEEPTFTAALYPSGVKGFLQGFMYQEDDDDDEEEEEPKPKRTSSSKAKSKKSNKSNNSSFAW